MPDQFWAKTSVFAQFCNVFAMFLYVFAFRCVVFAIWGVSRRKRSQNCPKLPCFEQGKLKSDLFDSFSHADRRFLTGCGVLLCGMGHPHATKNRRGRALFAHKIDVVKFWHCPRGELKHPFFRPFSPALEGKPHKTHQTIKKKILGTFSRVLRCLGDPFSKFFPARACSLVPVVFCHTHRT